MRKSPRESRWAVRASHVEQQGNDDMGKKGIKRDVEQ
jgi:hypothetical protein